MKRTFGTSVRTSVNQTFVDGWLLLLRIGVAALMLTHGLPKFFKLLEGNMTFGDPLGIGSGLSLVLATFAEVGCSILLIIGAYTRLVTLPLLFTMLVAVSIVHSADLFGKKELPLLYILIFITLLVFGSGKYSVDGRAK